MLPIMISVLFAPFLLYGAYKRSLFTLNFLLCLCIFQNIMLVLISPHIDSIGYNILVLIKEIFVFLTIVFGLIHKPKIGRMDGYCIVCILLLLISSLVYGSGTMRQILVSLRQLYLPFVFYLFARQIYISESDFIKFTKFFVSLCVVCSMFGVLELMVGDSFWEKLNYRNYSLIKIGTIQIVNGHYNSVAMYSYDLYFIVHKMLKRMSSLLVDPVILAQILALGTLFLFFVKNLVRYQKACFVLVAISLVITFGKGGIIIATLAGAYLIKAIYHQKQVANFLIIVGINAVVFAVIYSLNHGLSGEAHIQGLMDYVRRLPRYPFGSGIGAAGNIAIWMGGLDTDLSGESFVGTVIGQMGIGIIIYFVFAVKLYKDTKSKLHYCKMTNEILTVTNIATVAMFLTSFINNTTISFTSCFIYFILLGVRIEKVSEVSRKS